MTPPDLIAVFLRPLNTTRIPYMVTGSVAAAIYGEPRLTQDVDLVLTLPADDPSSLIQAFPGDAYYVPPPEALVEESHRPAGGHFNLMHLETGLRADCYFAGESPLARWGLEHRRTIQVGADPIWVAAPEYVIISKLVYHRDGGGEKHLDDIARMFRVSGPGIVRETIVEWITRLGLEPGWQQALARLEVLGSRL